MNDLQKVERAASYLDVIKPGWADNVNLNTLDMGNCDRCVCGQNELDWGKVAVEYGNLIEDVASARDTFASLVDEWTDAINARKTPIPPVIEFVKGDSVLLREDSTFVLSGDLLTIIEAGTMDEDACTINLHALRMAQDAS